MNYYDVKLKVATQGAPDASDVHRLLQLVLDNASGVLNAHGITIAIIETSKEEK